MSTYKLTYFDVRGRGEISRLLFAVAGQKYEDNRIKFDKWPELKPNSPFGQIPYLEVDGVTICQSAAIARFLANRFGLAGKTDIEKAQADMIVDCIADSVHPYQLQLKLEKDEDKRKELTAKISKESIPNHIANLEKLLISNKGGDGYFVGDSLTWADIRFIDAYKILTSLGLEPDLGAAPKLKALKVKVESHPKIAEWIRIRPETNF